MLKEKKNHIVEEGGKFKLLSHEGKNLGIFDSRAAAEKHEAEVEYFKEKKNVKSTPKIFYCSHMEPGLCGYENETVLLNENVLKSMSKSMEGAPVFVGHQKVDLENLQTQADGYVSDCFYNQADGKFWAKFVAVSDAAHNAISRGWSVSTAYVPEDWKGGGSHHNIDYDREITNARFTHLAIVPNPRYENARIYTPEEFKNYNEKKLAELKELQNSTPKGVFKMKFFRTKREEIQPSDATDNDMVVLENGKEMSVKAMADAILANDKADKERLEKENAKKQVDANTKIKVGDVEMTQAELVEKYNSMMKAKDEESERLQKENAEKEEEEKKKKAKEKAETEEEEKKNAKYFEELRNAGGGTANDKIVLQTPDKQLARGRERY